MLYNVRRLSKLLLRGKYDQIISPPAIEGSNNFNKLVRFTNNKITAVLRDTLNTTLTELATAAKGYPKNFLKNTVCFAPNVMRLLREKQNPRNRNPLKQRIIKLQTTLGTECIFHILITEYSNNIKQDY